MQGGGLEVGPELPAARVIGEPGHGLAQAEQDVLLFANPASQKGRSNGTVRLSRDDGKTWPVARQIHAGGYAYSCLTQLRDGSIGLLFEAYGVASRGASTAGRLASTTARFWGSILGPVLRSPIVDPVRRPYEFLLERGSQELERWAHIGRAEERRSRELARRLTMIPVDDIVSYLRDNPGME